MSENDDRNDGPQEPSDWETGGSVFDRDKSPRGSDPNALHINTDGPEVLGRPSNPIDSRPEPVTDETGTSLGTSSLPIDSGFPGAKEVDILSAEEQEQLDLRASRRAERRVATWFTISTIATLGFVIANFAGDKHKQYYTPLLGICLGLSMAGLGFGVIIWAKRLIPHEDAVQEREIAYSLPGDVESTEKLFGEGVKAIGLSQRPLLRRTMIGSLTALGAVAIVPLVNFGPFPKKTLNRTGWVRGARFVTEDGAFVKLGDLDIGGLITVFPAVPNGRGGYTKKIGTQDKAIDATILIRMRVGDNRPRPGRATWAHQGHVAYSKICTHAGCPVGLYEQQTHHLLCPCHQSVFDVPDGCRRIAGPATRSLPQLAITVDADDYFVAQGPYSEPVGPGYWER
jgi:ubiquinol-cytochrome c reductase iron-sulfur subunit